MRLAAIYIPAKTLPYILGANHEGQTLNLGGQYHYNIEEQEESLDIKSREHNSNFIKEFWGKDISLVSAIVGRNGTGKTTILRAINQEFDLRHQDVLHIFEDESNNSKIFILNETNKKATSNLALELEHFTQRNLEKQYYSPVLDYELQDTRSAISLVNYVQGNLEEHYFDSITRNILFLNEPIISDLSRVYPDFPSYDKYFIRIVQHRKSDFRKPYIDVNMGNPNKASVAINYVDGEIMRLENDIESKSFDKENVLSILKNFRRTLEGDSFTTLFTWLWELEDYKSSNEFEYIHDGDNFVKNLEVTLLSHIILGAVFPQTGLHGGFDFREELNESTFIEKLDKLLEYYFSNQYEVLNEIIVKRLSKVTIDKKEDIIAIIDSDKFTSIRGVKTDRLKLSMKNDLEMFSKIKELYEHLTGLIKNDILHLENGSLVFSINESNISVYKEIVVKYKEVLEALKSLPITPSILQFVPNKKLSSGEKSLIDFYASINNYIDRFKSSRHQCHENYLLLLDEPELGYHPLWKKKFIRAITSTLPILFSKIQPTFYDDGSKKYIDSEKPTPNIQIIFSTHDPLTLSDIPNQNIIYLDKDELGGKTFIVDNSDKKSFGANVHDLLADSFFLQDGFMGEFAEEWITDLIHYLTYQVSIDVSSIQKRKHKRAWSKDLAEKFITLIDEPLIKERVEELFNEKFLYKDKIALISKLKEIQDRIERMDNEEN